MYEHYLYRRGGRRWSGRIRRGPSNGTRRGEGEDRFNTAECMRTKRVHLPFDAAKTDLLSYRVTKIRLSPSDVFAVEAFGYDLTTVPLHICTVLFSE